MSEPEETPDEKTEEPSPRKLEDARRRGEVARSQDLGSAAVLVLGVLALALGGSHLVTELSTLMQTVLPRAAAADTRDMAVLLDLGWHTAARVLAPLAVALFVLGHVVQFLQIGPVFSFEPMRFKLDRLDPVKGLQQRFFAKRVWFQLLKSIVMLVLVGALTWLFIEGSVAELLALGAASPRGVAIAIADLSMRLAAAVAAAYFVLAILDVVVERLLFRKRMRMSRRELEREAKDDGEGEVKQRRKERHRELAEGQMMAGIPASDVTMVNPTHIACTLRYDPERENAPRLVAKGRGELAERIKQLSRASGVPVLRDVPFARALIHVDLDAEIPEELYESARVVLHWVQEIAEAEGRVPSWVSSGS